MANDGARAPGFRGPQVVAKPTTIDDVKKAPGLEEWFKFTAVLKNGERLEVLSPYEKLMRDAAIDVVRRGCVYKILQGYHVDASQIVGRRFLVVRCEDVEAVAVDEVQFVFNAVRPASLEQVAATGL